MVNLTDVVDRPWYGPDTPEGGLVDQSPLAQELGVLGP
jgi:hypothetical protein